MEWREKGLAAANLEGGPIRQDMQVPVRFAFHRDGRAVRSEVLLK